MTSWLMKAAAAVAIAVCACGAHAGIVRFDSGLGDQYLPVYDPNDPDAAAIDGSFDTAGQVNPGESVSGATITANFYKAKGGWVFDHGVDSDYSIIEHCNIFGCYVAQKTRTHTGYYTQAPAGATLSAGTSQATSWASTYYSQYYPHYRREEWNCGGYTVCVDIYMSHYAGYYGLYSVVLALDSTALAELNGTGKLDFNVQGLAMDSRLVSVVMDANIVQLETSNVPEPVSIALTGVALAGLGVARRKRRRAC